MDKGGQLYCMPGPRHGDAPSRTSAQVHSLEGMIDEDREVSQSVSWSRTDGEGCSRRNEVEQSVLSGENGIVYSIPGVRWEHGG